MPEKSTFVVTVEKRGSQSPEQTKAAVTKSESYSEKEKLAIAREDYFFKVSEQNKERRQAITMLNGEYSDLLKLLTSLSSIGIGAILFKKECDSAFTIAYVLSLVFMSLSLLCAALSYLFSIRSLSAWILELNHLDKTYDEMEQISNDLLHFSMALSGVFFIASCISYLCYVAQ